MGIYDRDYYDEGNQPGVTLRSPQSIVVSLIVANVVLFLIDGLVWPDTHRLTAWLAVSDQTLFKPWLWWQFLTYGFAHDPTSIWHIFFNMLQLWFLGRVVEQLYGRAEFLRIYLVMIVLGSLVFGLASELVQGQGYTLVGASGAVSGVVMLFVLNFPNQTLVLFPIPIPVKAWVIGVLLVVANVWGSLSPESGNTAFSVHLVGIAFAYLYVRNRWSLGWLGTGNWRLPSLRRRPRLKVHQPAKDDEDLSAEVDRILEKIHREGEESLTRRERRTLEDASRKYQRRRDG